MKTFAAILFFCLINFLWTSARKKNNSDLQAAVTSLLNGLWSSFLMMVLVAMFLGVIGVFTLGTWMAVSLAASAHRIPKLVKQRTELGPEHLAGICAPGLLFLFVWIAPEPGEWIAGGWDPGVYMNQGIAMSKTGSLYPDDQWFHDLIPEEYQPAFLRIFRTRVERFPGVVIHGQQISYQFSRFFPAALGLFAEIGGVGLASRMNYWIGLLCLATAAGWGWMISPKFTVLLPILLAVQSIFSYHLNLPVTEMLELGLVLWAGMIFFQNREMPGDSARIAFALFCAILNRFSMVPFSGLFFLISALLLLSADLSVKERAGILGAFLLSTGSGLALSFIISPVSIRGWSVTPLLLHVYGWSTLTAALVLFIPLSQTWRQRLAVWINHAFTFALPLAILGILAFYGYRGALERHPPYLQRLIPFIGTGWAILFPVAALSTGVLRRYSPGAKMFCVFLVSVSILLLQDPQITEWYPWALRRFLSFTIPMLLLMIVCFVEFLTGLKFPKAARIGTASALLLAAFLFSGKMFLDGLRFREYRGLDAALSAVADLLPDDAVIVSDDPRWGTPLRLVHGKKVLCGRGLWQRDDSELFEVVLEMLSDLPKVYFVTSLETGLNVFPEMSPDFGFEPVNVLGPMTFETIIQHPRAGSLVLRPMERVFKIHRFMGRTEAGPEAPLQAIPQTHVP